MIRVNYKTAVILAQYLKFCTAFSDKVCHSVPGVLRRLPKTQQFSNHESWTKITIPKSNAYQEVKP